MTEPRHLADRLVERTFGKKPLEESIEEPKPPQSIAARVEAAQEIRKRRQALVKHFEEF